MYAIDVNPVAGAIMDNTLLKVLSISLFNLVIKIFGINIKNLSKICERTFSINYIFTSIESRT
jgi:hypothetical protein